MPLSLLPTPITVPPLSEPEEISQIYDLPPPSNAVHVDALLRRNDWAGIDQALSGRALGPALSLLRAIAKKELGNVAGDADPMAIAAVANLMGVSQHSATAIIIAKRILRANPSSWKVKEVPTAPVSILLIAFVLVLGGMAGYFGGPGVSPKMLEFLLAWF